jgi:hypothetical protein
MKKLTIGLLVAIVLAGLTASLLLRNRAQVQLLQKEAVSRQQDRQLAELTQEHQRLSNLVVQAANRPGDSQMGELERLRGEAARLRKQTNELGEQLRANRQSRQSRTGPAGDPKPPEYYQQLVKMSAGKTRDGKTLGLAFATYALDHDGQIPSSPDEVASALREAHESVTGTNEFEILYHGSPGKLKIPRGQVAMLRDKQVWPGPDGTMTRIYVMADGTAQIVQSDDNFQGWEAQFILPPASGGPER